MSLLADLAQARTEEDVKDAYIKALGLKSYSKNLVDIQTQEIWFEAKAVSTSPIVMFAQLLFYIRAARKRGEAIPAFLAVIDRDKAAIMPTDKALPLLDDKKIAWPKAGSQAGKDLAAHIAPYVQAHIVEYTMAHDEAAFVKAVKDAIQKRRIIRTPITPDNLRQVFDRWVDLIGSELGTVNPADYAVLFFADIMHDGTHEAMNNLRSCSTRAASCGGASTRRNSLGKSTTSINSGVPTPAGIRFACAGGLRGHRTDGFRAVQIGLCCTWRKVAADGLRAWFLATVARGPENSPRQPSRE